MNSKRTMLVVVVMRRMMNQIKIPETDWSGSVIITTGGLVADGEADGSIVDMVCLFNFRREIVKQLEIFN